MSKNAHALKFIRAVGQTPGYRMEPQERGRFKLIRAAVPEYGVPEATITVSGNAADRQHQNDLTRAKNKLGWTQALYENLEEIAREHRIKETDPAPAQLLTLLGAWGVTPDQEDTNTDADVPRQAQRKRHGKGGTATGSVKTATLAAQPAAPVDEAAVELLDGPGRMQRELIRPERALDLLTKLAPYQRKLDEKKVKDYAAAMKRGEWKLNPADPLCIDTNGQTANGQHRLHACVEAEVPFPCWVAYDTEPSVYDVMDRGKKRTTGDMLYGAGEVNTSLLASLARFAHLWFNVEQEQWKAAPNVTEAQVFAILEAHPRLRDSVRHGRFSKMKVSTQASMLAHYLITRKMGGDDRLVNTWYKAIAEMALDRGEPGHTLGLYFYRGAQGTQRRTELKGRPRRDLDMYLILQAWNNTCLGKEVRNVSWDSAFAIPDPILPKDGVHTFPPIS